MEWPGSQSCFYLAHEKRPICGALARFWALKACAKRDRRHRRALSPSLSRAIVIAFQRRNRSTARMMPRFRAYFMSGAGRRRTSFRLILGRIRARTAAA
jgi:hypothetical protein